MLPDSPRSLDVGLLAALGATAQQDHYPTPLHSKVNSVTGPEIQTQLLHTFPNALRMGPAAQRQPRQRRRDSGGNDRIQAVEPVTKRARTRRVDVLENLKRNQWLHLRYHCASAEHTGDRLNSLVVLECAPRAKQSGIS